MLLPLNIDSNNVLYVGEVSVYVSLSSYGLNFNTDKFSDVVLFDKLSWIIDIVSLYSLIKSDKFIDGLLIVWFHLLLVLSI